MTGVRSKKAKVKIKKPVFETFQPGFFYFKILTYSFNEITINKSFLLQIYRA